MLRSKMVRFSAVALIGFACMLAREARATGELPIGLPAAALTAPTSCTVVFSGKTLRVDAVPGGASLTFPYDVTGGSCPGGQTCSRYDYQFTLLSGATTLSSSYVTMSSDLTIYAATPGAVFINDCIADKTPANGVNVCHHREAKFNSSPSPLNASVIVTRSAPRISTAGAFVGTSSGFCSIQGPGVPGDPFKTVTAKSTIVVVHGQCPADVTNGPDGGFTSLTLPGNSPCTLTVLPPGVPFILDGQPIQFAPGDTATTGPDSCWYALVNGRQTRVCS